MKEKENLEDKLNEFAVDNPVLNLAFKRVVEIDVAHQTFPQIVGKQNAHLLQLLLCPSDLRERDHDPLQQRLACSR